SHTISPSLSRLSCTRRHSRPPQKSEAHRLPNLTAPTTTPPYPPTIPYSPDADKPEKTLRSLPPSHPTSPRPSHHHSPQSPQPGTSHFQPQTYPAPAPGAMPGLPGSWY